MKHCYSKHGCYKCDLVDISFFQCQYYKDSFPLLSKSLREKVEEKIFNFLSTEELQWWSLYKSVCERPYETIWKEDDFYHKDGWLFAALEKLKKIGVPNIIFIQFKDV